MCYAQRGGGEMGGGEMGGMGGMREGGGMGRTQHQSKADQIADKLKLNKDQRQQLEAILSAAREKAQPIGQQMDHQRAQIAGAMIDGKSGDDLQPLLTGYAGMAGQMISVETDAYSKIYAMLKPNQQGKAGQAFELMAGMFARPAASRGRGEAR
jgi:hypothetical protein